MMETVDLPYPMFQCPGSLLINGPSMSGKTGILCRLLIHRDLLFTKRFQNIIYCYTESPGVVSNIDAKIHLHNGLPDQDTLNEWIDSFDNEPWVLAMDDMSSDFYNSDISAQLLSRLVHHHNCFLIIISHSLFGGGKHARLASLNFHYFILTRSCRDTLQIGRFGIQILGKGHSNQFLQIYQDATDLRTSQRPGYLVIDIHPRFGHKTRMLFTNIFNEDGEPLVLYRF